MKMHEILVWLSSLIAFFLYYPLFRGIIRDEIRQSFATWALWVSLDAIALFSIMQQKGNFILVGLYTICGTLITLTLIFKKQVFWSTFETVVLTLVIGCLVIYSMSGPLWATISSTIALCISGAPQVRDSYRSPNKTTGVIYYGYAVANSLSLIGGKSWTIEERFYPGMSGLLCIIIAILASREKTSK